ncbi:condensin-2 complex subunit H2 [Stegostoma tigrinum]|uniref:condensin-2 complex subunit H2 n=1 Tax=Stegostoma tigrinum TaxID=3053191 RepID=UPI00202BA196|nr:condensin-2 complex subunit H2 [Stegostoma tigrinum]XP_048410556.1 condensin-2 complex subunit H2 [Stegostoma tigrinum]XP_048410557.1 condensin-2 complex subunit H2 [Stegostoma tigrinum]XP_048410558.1 condensin-2 complex subunit H2 [Stegostoma tigrinum]XP_059510515.1 condensin-2 complex subunit H2 [Stegostoma tigrinum]
MEDVESRFTHLLQPIRELTKNWEIDVASQLGEYLEELDQICISFDDGKTTMNFAEAALLIQGSACIYSRKVEYLHSLVFQALDLISNKKRNQKVTSIAADGTDNDVSLANDQDWEFLSLDDIECPSKASIDLQMDHSSNVVNIIPLTPMALVPLEEIEKKNNPLLSRRGEILGSRKDFRMNTCTPHATGAFMLELATVSPMSYLHRQQQGNTEYTRNGLQNVQEDMGMDNSDCQAPVPVLNFLDEAGMDDDGGDADGNFVPPSAEGDFVQEHIATQKAENENRGYVLRKRDPVVPDVLHTKEVLDPWRSLDPFEATQDKPFKKGIHFVIPPRVDITGGKRKRKTFVKLKDFGKWFSETYYGGWSEAKSRKRGPTFADMDVLYWQHMKDRLRAQRKHQQMMIALRGRVIEELDVEAGNMEEELNDLQERAEDHLDNDGLEDDYDINLDQEADAAQDNHSPPNLEPFGEMGSACYEELVRRNVELFIANSQQYAKETALSLRVRDWEEKIGPRLEEQDERAAFDIHDYGIRIMDAFDCIRQRRSFASIVAGKEAFEVCRYMLATLQLANDYTVDIWQKEGLYESVDTMELTLLSKVRAHERFRTYMAPSISNK